MVLIKTKENIEEIHLGRDDKITIRCFNEVVMGRQKQVVVKCSVNQKGEIEVFVKSHEGSVDYIKYSTDEKIFKQMKSELHLKTKEE